MVVERVGFHSNLGTFRQSGHMKTPLRLAIINGLPFNPTYDLAADGWRKAVYGTWCVPTTLS